jgi:hypothetical protein
LSTSGSNKKAMPRRKSMIRRRWHSRIRVKERNKHTKKANLIKGGSVPIPVTNPIKGDIATEEEKVSHPKQYVIPVEEPQKVKKKTKKGKKSQDETNSSGIKIVKDKDSLAVKMPKFQDFRFPENKIRPLPSMEEKKEAPKGKKGVKKAPINVGSTRIV